MYYHLLPPIAITVIGLISAGTAVFFSWNRGRERLNKASLVLLLFEIALLYPVANLNSGVVANASVTEILNALCTLANLIVLFASTVL